MPVPFGLSSLSIILLCVQITYLRDTEKQGIELTAMTDLRASWPTAIAQSLFDLGKRCTEIESHKRPLATEVCSLLPNKAAPLCVGIIAWLTVLLIVGLVCRLCVIWRL